MSSMQVPTQTHYKHQLEAGRSSFDQFYVETSSPNNWQLLDEDTQKAPEAKDDLTQEGTAR